MTTPSSWPFLFSGALLNVALRIIEWLKGFHFIRFILAISCLTFISFCWIKDIFEESFLGGYHTIIVKQNFKLALILFI